MLRFRRSASQLPIVVTLTSCLVVFGVATVVAAGSASTAEFARSAVPVAGAVQSVPSEVQQRFAIFRGPSKAGMPADVAQEMASPAMFGRNASLARQIATTNGVGWIVPGRDRICIVVPDPVDGYGTVCTLTSRALNHGVVLTMRKARESGPASVTLLAPDGLDVIETTPATKKQVPTSLGVASRVVPEGVTLAITARD